MKTIFLTMAAATALSVGAPAAAQFANSGYQNGAGVNVSMSARIEQLRSQIQAGAQSGAISRAEAQSLRQQFRALTQLERQYSAGGLTNQERSDLQQRFRNLRQQVRTADGGAQGRYDRDDRWDDDAWNGSTNGAYEQPAARGGLGGAIDSALGGGSLRVGQRATGNLSALPYEYRNQFRDSQDTYFRTDGRQIYQIDARTQTVARVYSMDDGANSRSGSMGGVLGNVLGGGRSSSTGGVLGTVLGGGQSSSSTGGVLGTVLGGGRSTGGMGGVLGNVLVGGGGIGGVLGNVVGGSVLGGGAGGILGGILGRGGLRSGDVITDTIGGVLGGASGFGSQFRDTNNNYYRSDGQRVYEIDTRTNTVNRVIPLQR